MCWKCYDTKQFFSFIEYSKAWNPFLDPNGDEIFGLDAIFLIEEYDGEPTPDNDEVSEVKWFSLDELPDNMHYPDLYFIDVIKAYLENKKIIIK